MGIAIVELERTDDALVDDERDDDTRLELARFAAETHGPRGLEDARDAILERHVRAHRLDGRVGQVILAVEARKTQDTFAVGDGNCIGRSCR